MEPRLETLPDGEVGSAERIDAGQKQIRHARAHVSSGKHVGISLDSVDDPRHAIEEGVGPGQSRSAQRRPARD